MKNMEIIVKGHATPLSVAYGTVYVCAGNTLHQSSGICTHFLTDFLIGHPQMIK